MDGGGAVTRDTFNMSINGLNILRPLNKFVITTIPQSARM